MIREYGGIVGYLYETNARVEYCYGEGALIGTADSGVQIGGVVGFSNNVLIPVKKCIVGFDMKGNSPLTRICGIIRNDVRWR